MAGEATAGPAGRRSPSCCGPRARPPTELAGLVRDDARPRDRRAGRRVGPSIVVGTGADRAHTVNISTMAALVVAGSGRTVVKHGNRAASSACGAADVLEELGVAIDLPAAGVAATVAERRASDSASRRCSTPGMRHAGAPRRELGVPTVFNFLGPLTNPARPPAAAIGCADARMAPVMAEVLAGRGDSALVFRGDDGLDELTTTTTSSVWVAAGGGVVTRPVDPTDLGHRARPSPAALRGGDRVFNAAVVRDLLAGKPGRYPRRGAAQRRSGHRRLRRLFRAWPRTRREDRCRRAGRCVGGWACRGPGGDRLGRGRTGPRPVDRAQSAARAASNAAE